MDYNTLTTQIQQYANRTDTMFVEQIPNFIDQAMNRIYSEAKSIGFEIFIGGTLNASTEFFQKPSDWKETISFSVINTAVNPAVTSYLLPRSYEFGTAYWPTSTVYGLPVFYADFGYDMFALFPGPNIAYPFTLIYRGIPKFNATYPQNFLTDRYPNLLLYACMLEATPFLKDDERVPVFESMYNRELQNVNRDKQITITDRTSKRDAN